MKRVTFIVSLVLCGCILCPTFANAQSLTPARLKAARHSVYDWVNQYNSSVKCDSRSAVETFKSLFASDTMMVYNDYYPMQQYDFATPYISVSRYASVIYVEDTFYQIQHKIISTKLVSEKYDGSKILYTIEIGKRIRFVQKDCYEENRFEYPYRELLLVAQLEYSLNDGAMVATSLRSKDQVDPFVVLHTEEGNSYTTISDLKRLGQEHSSAFVVCGPQKLFFDPKMFVMAYDTIKNYVGFGCGIGAVNESFQFSDDRISAFNVGGDNQFSYWGVYYRQLHLKDIHRLGIEMGMRYYGTYTLLSACFDEKYAAVDPDGSGYERIINVDKYTEAIQRSTLAVPINLRYDYILSSHFSLTAKAGVSVGYDIVQRSLAAGNVLYSGHYAWLFDVTIDQNGIYDFGRFNLDAKANELGIKRFSVDAALSLGGCYQISSQWAIEAAFRYGRTIWSSLAAMPDYHLTRFDGDWTSLSYSLIDYSQYTCGLMLQINYNF